MKTKLFKSINRKGLILALLLLCAPSLWANVFVYVDYYVNNEDGTTSTGTIQLECTVTSSDDEEYPTVSVVGISNLIYAPDDINLVIGSIVQAVNGKYYKVTEIGNTAFYSPSYGYKIKSVEIPSTVTSIGQSAFYNCTNLTSVTIPESVTTIGTQAFCYCYSLQSITIPSSVTTLGDFSFYDCTSLTSIEIPESVTTIGMEAFTFCTALTSVTIPTSITDWGDFLFYGCTALNTLTLSEGLTTIEGIKDFYGCSALTSVKLPESLAKIGDCVFYECTGLTSVSIPESVTDIGFMAFEDCVSLNSVYIPGNPENGTIIKDGAFCVDYSEYPDGRHDAEDMTLTIGENVTAIGGCVFWNNTNLKTINFDARNCSLATFITEDYYFDDDGGLKIQKSDPLLDSFPRTDGSPIFDTCPKVEKINIGDSVTIIPDYLFTAFDNSVGFDGYSYPEIGHFGKLTSITIPKTVKSIGQNAFYGCEALETLTFEAELNEVGDSAFFHCNSLETVYEKRSLKQLRGDYNNGEPDVPTAGKDCFTKGATYWDKYYENTDTTFIGCFLVVPEDAARFYTEQDNEGDYVGYGAIVPTSYGWNTIPYLREDTVTIPMTTPEGYVTRYSPYSYKLENGLKGGIITAVDSDTGELTIDWIYDGSVEGIDTIPAGSSILVKGPQGEAYSASFTNPTWNTNYENDSTTVSESGSMMYGTVNPYYNETESKQKNGVTNMPVDVESSDDYFYYKLSYFTNEYGDRTLGFYWQNNQGAAFAIKGGDNYGSGIKLAWLTVGKETNAKAIRSFYPLDVNSTGIQSIEATYPNGEMQRSGSDIIYNLQGIRVKDMTKKGIYIINGKKVLR